MAKCLTYAVAIVIFAFSNCASASGIHGADGNRNSELKWGSAPMRILPLGDSITYGVGSTAYPPSYIATSSSVDGGYRAPLYRALTDSGVGNESFVFVGPQLSGPDWLAVEQRNHSGYPGYTIAQVADIAPTWLPYQPDVILVHLGTNDVHLNHSVAQMLSDMDRLLNLTVTALENRRAGTGPGAGNGTAAVQIFVATIISRGLPVYVKNLTAYNAALPALVSSYSANGHNVSLVDMNARSGICAVVPSAARLQPRSSRHATLRSMTDPAPSPTPAPVDPRNDCCADRVHPTQAGYSIMAGIWWEYLRPLFP